MKSIIHGDPKKKWHGLSLAPRPTWIKRVLGRSAWELADGNYWEPAKLTEKALRAQCRRWIKDCE